MLYDPFTFSLASHPSSPWIGRPARPPTCNDVVRLPTSGLENVPVQKGIAIDILGRETINLECRASFLRTDR